MLRQKLRDTTGYTRNERRLARALLLSCTLHLLREAREQAIKFGVYDSAKRYDERIMKRLDKIWEVLDEYYYLR